MGIDVIGWVVFSAVFYDAVEDLPIFDSWPELLKNTTLHIRMPDNVVRSAQQLFFRIAGDIDKVLIDIGDDSAGIGFWDDGGCIKRFRITSYNVCYTKLLRVLLKLRMLNSTESYRNILRISISQIIVITSYSIHYTKLYEMIMKELGGFVALVSFCIQKLPNIFLDKLYFLLATNRYRIWGKRKRNNFV